MPEVDPSGGHGVRTGILNIIQMVGTIPTELSQLTGLVELDLVGNLLAGE